MEGVTTSQWRSLERWSPTAFLVAGGILVVYATFNGLAAFTDTVYPLVENVVGPGGFVLGFLGLLGLYPRLADRRPRQAKAAVVFASLGAVGFSVITVSNIGRLAGVVPNEPLPWFPLLLGMVAVGMVLGYLSFGVISLRADVYPRFAGPLLLLPALIFSVMAVGGLTGAATPTGAFFVSSAQAAVHLSIWHTLRKGISSDEHQIQSAEMTTGY
jgi:hypothetical protein